MTGQTRRWTLIALATAAVIGCSFDATGPSGSTTRAGNTRVITDSHGRKLSLDVSTGVLSRDGGAPIRLSKSAASRLNKAFRRMDSTDKFVEGFEKDPRFAKVRSGASQKKLHFARHGSAVSASAQPGSSLRPSAMVVGKAQSRPLQGIRSGSIHARGTNGGIGSPLAFDYTEYTNVDGWDCTDIALAIYDMTNSYKTDKNNLMDYISNMVPTADGTIDPSDGGALAVLQTTVLEDETTLDYLATEYSSNGCWAPSTTPDYTSYMYDQSDTYDFLAGGPVCWDDYWEIDVSYDGGATWDVYEYMTVQVCDDGEGIAEE